MAPSAKTPSIMARTPAIIIIIIFKFYYYFLNLYSGVKSENQNVGWSEVRQVNWQSVVQKHGVEVL